MLLPEGGPRTAPEASPNKLPSARRQQGTSSDGERRAQASDATAHECRAQETARSGRFFLERYAAGNLDHRAIDVTGFVGREPCVGVGDFLGCAEPAHRHSLFDRPQHFVGDGFENRRFDEAGTDRVCADALAAEFARPGLDHADDAELGRCVVCLAEIAVETDDRRRVEDASGILLQHDIDDCLGAVVDALEIDVDDANRTALRSSC